MLELYHHGSSVCAAKVRFALAEKELEWDGHYLDILAGDQFDPAYMKLNPKAVVPTLVHGDNVVVESTVINEYLEEVFPQTRLTPSDPGMRAKMRLWTKAVDEDLHPACGELTFVSCHRHIINWLGPEGAEKFLSSTPPSSVTAAWHARKRTLVEQGFDAAGVEVKVKLYDDYLSKMETALQDRDWLAGDSFSLADIALTPYVNRLDMLSMSGLWESTRPRVADWFTRIKARPAFKPSFLDWCPEKLTNDLKTYGAQSRADVERILQATN